MSHCKARLRTVTAPVRKEKRCYTRALRLFRKISPFIHVQLCPCYVGFTFEQEPNLLYPHHSEDRRGLSARGRIILTFHRPQQNHAPQPEAWYTHSAL